MRAAVAQAGFLAEIDSAGTSDWHAGHPPDLRAQDVARRHGIDISGLRARQVTLADFDRFQHVVAMDSQNLRDLSALQPAGAPARLSRLLDHLDVGTFDVPDPYYGDMAAFEHSFQLVHAGVEAMLLRLQANG